MGLQTCSLQWYVGASTVKWTAPDPCLVLSESDSILCTNFESCEEKKHTNLQRQVIHDDKKNSKKSLHILEDGASRWYWTSDCPKYI